jgi:Protein of unknown function (DUF2844)
MRPSWRTYSGNEGRRGCVSTLASVSGLTLMRDSFFFLTVLAVTAFPAWAALGGSVESVETDQSKLHAKRAVVERRDYTVHEITSDDGTVIREYVTPAGQVFGVSWTGPTIPDLTQLLGTYNTEFQATIRSKRGRRSSTAVHNADLVVESSGHMRAFYGRAYLNSMLPGGVTPEIVK